MAATEGEARHTLWISGDNDFMDLPNMVFVVALSDADLPGYEAATPVVDCATCN